MTAVEANFDGLVGPTHNYAGLAWGNVASAHNARRPSNPRDAALQGLAKMRELAQLGLVQGLLPPQERPHLPTLRRLGYSGRDTDILSKVQKEAPALLATVSSASAMWAANAATVSPGADSADGRVHFTPANLCSQLHRAIEAEATARILRTVFPDPQHFVHHEPLPATPACADEGAANHLRLCAAHGEPGLEVFVYGRGHGDERCDEVQARRYPARQTRAAGEAIALLHGLDPAHALYVRQNPAAIDRGVFHNDVIALAHRELLLYHEEAFADAAALRGWICTHLPGARPLFIEVMADEVSVDEAVASYLFNSQLLDLSDGGLLLAVARECEEQPRVWAQIQRIVADPANPVTAVRVFDLRQSMRNGGGPACLRLRVVLDESQRAAVHAGAWITPPRADALEQWVQRHYRDRLTPDDLADPQLLDESRTALDRLTQLLELGSLYEFQRGS